MAIELSNVNAIREIKRIVREGTVRYSKNHFWTRQKDRKIDMTDVQRVIRAGYIVKNSVPEYDCERDVYKYRVCGQCDGRDIIVIVALRHKENVIDIVSVFARG